MVLVPILKPIMVLDLWGNTKGILAMTMVEMDLMGETFLSINNFKVQEITMVTMTLDSIKDRGLMEEAILEVLQTEIVVFLALLIITKAVQIGILGWK